MKRIGYIFLMVTSLLAMPLLISAQEEESAEVFLEQYTDEFQELFFEALKQKGIENYDKAINLLLKCKLLNSESSVLDHELAKAYRLNNQFLLAQEYAVAAINSEPTNLWYLNTLVEVRKSQGADFNGIQDQIPYGDIRLKENLARIYFKKEEYRKALDVLKELRSSSFTRELTLMIQDSIAQNSVKEEQETIPEAQEETDFLLAYTQQMNALIGEKDFRSLKQVTEEALEIYPSQPYFYYARGLASNQLSNNKEAIEFLNMALDYLLEDEVLASKIYKELATAYTALGDTKKANMYLSKLKNGS